MTRVVELTPSADLAALRAEVADAEVIVVAPRANARLREVWPHARNVRWVHALAAGVESLLFDELIASDVIVTNGRGVFAGALGEFVVAAILWFAKDLGRMRSNQQAHRWEPFTVTRIEGQTAGIVGYGSIGRAIGARCEALGMRVLAVRRSGGDALDDVLAESDYLAIAAPLTPSTRGLIGAAQLARMKQDAVLINVGRGAIVDETALIDALRSGALRGAALDVFAEEPLPESHALWSLDNVLLSPHCADHTADSHARARQLFAANLGRFERGEPLVNILDKLQRY